MITGQKIFSLLKALAVSYIITAILLLVTALLMYKLGLGETCLLYTSPSPRDPKTSRMPSSA